MSRTERLSEVTPAMRADYPRVVAEWTAVGLSTQPADRPTAEEGVRMAYRAAGLEPPREIVWLESPMAGAPWAASVRDSVRASAWASVWDSVLDSVLVSVRDSVRASVRASIRDSVWVSVRASVRASAWASVWASVRASVRDSVLVSVRASVWEAVYGQHDAEIMAFYDVFARHGLADLVEPLAGQMAVARSAGWWWPRENACCLTERPVALHRDERGRLHATDRMAIEYPDGWGVYAIHGVRVPKQVVMRPETLTALQIRDERNAEVRRIMLERFGAERYLREIGAQRVATDEYGTLWRADLADDEPLVMVEVVNATPEPDGSFRNYWLRVPPDTRSPLAAVAWTFDMPAEQYRRAVHS